MKKKLNTTGIINELRGESSYFRTAKQAPTSAAADDTSSDTGLSTDDTARSKTTDQTTTKSTDESSHQSTHQSTQASTKAATAGPFDYSVILSRPKAFYITEQQDADLDQAVNQLTKRVAGKVGQTVDRSTLVRLLLERADLANPATIEQLHGQLVSRLISQLTSQLHDQSTDSSTSETTTTATGRSFDHSPLLGRPKAFYITEQQDKDLDSAVGQLAARVQGKINQSIERSTIVRLLLEEADLTGADTIEQLHKQLVSRLISQLTSQSTS